MTGGATYLTGFRIQGSPTVLRCLFICSGGHSSADKQAGVAPGGRHLVGHRDRTCQRRRRQLSRSGLHRTHRLSRVRTLKMHPYDLSEDACVNVV